VAGNLKGNGIFTPPGDGDSKKYKAITKTTAAATTNIMKFIVFFGTSITLRHTLATKQH